MRKNIFIAGTGTGIGKTTVASAFAYGCTQRGLRVGYWKPVSSGLPSDSEVVAQHAPAAKIFPPCFAYGTPISPHAAAVEEQKAAVNLPTLVARLNKIQRTAQLDILLSEAAGGLLVPLNERLQTWLEVLARSSSSGTDGERADFFIVLVAHSGLGTLNHTTLSLRCLRDNGFAVGAVVLCGEPFHDNEAVVQRVSDGIPVHSLANCAELSASKDWSAHSHALTQFLLDGLARDSEKEGHAWRAYDDSCVWHPFTRYPNETKPRAIVRANGVWLTDSRGQRLIDGISSWWTNNIGHGHSAIAHSCAAQIRQCDHVAFAGLTHAPAAQLAHTMVELSGKNFARVFFSDNGSTAVEVAMKIAFQYQRNRGHAQRDTFVALHGAYHGDTVGAMSLSDVERFRSEFNSLLFTTLRLTPITSHASNICPEGRKGLAANLKACKKLFADNASRICAIIVEPLVQGAAGMLMQEMAWLQGISKLAQEHDIPLIFDEVFTGLGRCGHDFAFQRAGIVPDILCLAKGLTGGVLPLGLTLARGKYFDSYVSAERAFMHGHTFTANPVVCRAALTALEIARQEDISGRALALEQRFCAWLADHQALLHQPRALGGILAFELNDAASAQALAQAAAEHQLYLRPLGSTIYLVPPLVISEDELTIALDALQRALAATA